MLRRFVRNHPFFNWLIVILTLGCHGFIWAFMLMRDANRIAAQPRIPVKLMVRVFLGCLVVYLAAFLTENVFIDDAIKGGTEHFSLLLLIIMVLCGSAMLFIICSGLARVTAILEANSSCKRQAVLLTVILTCAYMASLPIIQHYMTRAEQEKADQTQPPAA